MIAVMTVPYLIIFLFAVWAAIEGVTYWDFCATWDQELSHCDDGLMRARDAAREEGIVIMMEACLPPKRRRAGRTVAPLAPLEVLTGAGWLEMVNRREKTITIESRTVH